MNDSEDIILHLILILGLEFMASEKRKRQHDPDVFCYICMFYYIQAENDRFCEKHLFCLSSLTLRGVFEHISHSFEDCNLNFIYI